VLILAGIATLFGKERRVNMEVDNTQGPLVYFEFATYYGGSFKSTVNLIRNLRHFTDIRVIDVYGTCVPYLRDLESLGINPIVLFPDWQGRTTIGGRTSLGRIASLACSIPHGVKVAIRLHKVLAELRPRAVWVDQEKTLFFASLSAPRDLPMAVYRRGELRGIFPYCAFAWRRADIALGVAECCLQYLRTTKYAHHNFRLLYDGIDADEVLQRAKSEPANLPSNEPGALRLVFPAALAGPAKGHEFGIRAVAKFVKEGGNVELWICGSVPPGASPEFCHKMRALVSELNVQKYVHFLGYRNDMLSVMAKADIVFLPSLTEGLPVSLMEAMALAKPVIATAVGGIPELVRDRTDGILVPPRDVLALTKALWALTNSDVRNRMGRSCQQRVRESFSVTQQAQEFVSIMDALVETESRGSWRGMRKEWSKSCGF
jgi:glycosyltransferase involved in cell wall biosynthesis